MLWRLLMMTRGQWFRRKSLADFDDEDHEEASLTLVDLLCIGIGGTVGSGVFVLTGDTYPVAGPSAALCWVIGAAVCLLSALSYMELSALVPTKGSTYAYAYHALGEFAAVAGATSLTLEYGLSGAGVARSWAQKLYAFWPSLKVLAFPYTAGSQISSSSSSDNYLDMGAALLQLICGVIVAKGFNLSKRVVNVMTVGKIVVVAFLILAGFCGTQRNVFRSSETFFPRGAAGVAKGTSLLFFGFIGFDEVCCMAARSKNPRKALPQAIAGTLFGAAVLSTLAQLALAGLLDNSDLQATSFEAAFRQRGWLWAKDIAEIGELLLLPLVVLLSFMPQPELMAALALDGVVPKKFADKNTNDVYSFGCFACGVALVSITLVVPFAVLWNVINLGVLLGFNISNASLISVRLGNGGHQTNPHAGLTLNLFACVLAPAAAYLLWKGAAGPAVNHGVVSTPTAQASLVFGTLFFLSGFLLLRHIAHLLSSSPSRRHQQKLDDDDLDHHRNLQIAPDGTSSIGGGRRSDDRRFQAPGVPYVPGAAIFLNFLLMAQYAWIDHLYFLALYASAYAMYILAKHDPKAKCDGFRQPLPSDSASSEDPLDEPLLTS